MLFEVWSKNVANMPSVGCKLLFILKNDKPFVAKTTKISERNCFAIHFIVYL